MNPFNIIYNWIFNPPLASHMGGVWERMNRTVLKVITGLLQEHGPRLDGIITGIQQEHGSRLDVVLTGLLQ